MYSGVVPNYFKSIVDGDYLVCSSATCIPRKIFTDKKIWFLPEEKYGEDQNVWARIAIESEIAYTRKECAIYDFESENNSLGKIRKEVNPHESILSLEKYKSLIVDEQKLLYFEKYLEKHILHFILVNILHGRKNDAFKQIIKYKHVGWGNKIKYLFILILPRGLYPIIKFLKKQVSI